jgi:hypothetical protein
VGRKTSYTLSNLEHGKVYHFNLFAVNRRTNLSFPYGRTTLKYEPRSKPTGLRDGKISSVNLRKMDGRATFKFKVMSIENNGNFHSKPTLILDTIHAKSLTASDLRCSILGFWPIPMAARSKTCVCGRSLARIAVSNPAGGMDVCLM